MSAPCDCCTTPPCVPPEIECKSISATGSKATPCGALNPADGKYYSTVTTTHADGHTSVTNYSVVSGVCSSATVHSGAIVTTCTAEKTETIVDPEVPDAWDSYYCYFQTVETKTYNADGSSSITTTGTYLYTHTTHWPGGDEDTDSISATLSGGVWSGTQTLTDGSTESWSGSPYLEHCGETVCVTDPVPTSEDTVIFSNEVTAETTSALISRVVGLLPAWSESWTGTCSAARNLSPDESSYSIRRFKWRLKHQPSGNCYLKVWLREVFTPEGGGSPTYTDLPPYEWSATGAPCLAAPNKAYFDLDNLIIGEESEIQEPSEDGTITVEIVKYSCLAGYTPGEGDPNGFPPPPAE